MEANFQMTSHPPPASKKNNKWIPKGDTATVIAGFVIVSGVILTALELPASELMIGAGIGYLFKTVTK